MHVAASSSAEKQLRDTHAWKHENTICYGSCGERRTTTIIESWMLERRRPSMYWRTAEALLVMSRILALRCSSKMGILKSERTKYAHPLT